MVKAPFQHAIVIGGGIAGLLAARVLTNHCDRITVIERDHYPTTPTVRAGTPQARQIHTFLLKGQYILEALFPGFGARLRAGGATKHDFASDGLYFYGGRCPRIASGLPGWFASRSLIEWQIRRELKAFPQVHFLENCCVKGLLYESVVRGVKYQERGNRENPIQHLVGDLVVDASGSSSAAPVWLKEIGYEPPSEEIINPGIGYATRLYERPKQHAQWWHGIAIAEITTPTRRSGALMEIEDGRWMVMLAGSRQDYPPTNPEGYLEFARSLPESTLYKSIKDSTPISNIYGYRPLGNIFRHFERIRMPQGFIVLGDAACTFNPLYGQGMTVAALEAQMLDRCLRTWHRRKDPVHHFQKQIVQLLTWPWMLATTPDSRPEDRKTVRARIAYWYVVNCVLPTIPKDVKVERTFIEVQSMLRSPIALLAPSILVRVFRRGVRIARRRRE